MRKFAITQCRKRVSSFAWKTSLIWRWIPTIARAYHDETLLQASGKVAHFCFMENPLMKITLNNRPLTLDTILASGSELVTLTMRRVDLRGSDDALLPALRQAGVRLLSPNHVRRQNR